MGPSWTFRPKVSTSQVGSTLPSPWEPPPPPGSHTLAPRVRLGFHVAAGPEIRHLLMIIKKLVSKTKQALARADLSSSQLDRVIVAHRGDHAGSAWSSNYTFDLAQLDKRIFVEVPCPTSFVELQVRPLDLSKVQNSHYYCWTKKEKKFNMVFGKTIPTIFDHSKWFENSLENSLKNSLKNSLTLQISRWYKWLIFKDIV